MPNYYHRTVSREFWEKGTVPSVRLRPRPAIWSTVRETCEGVNGPKWFTEASARDTFVGEGVAEELLRGFGQRFTYLFTFAMLDVLLSPPWRYKCKKGLREIIGWHLDVRLVRGGAFYSSYFFCCCCQTDSGALRSQ